MQIGARTAAWAKSGGWVNPYVTDGLVAMWDGVWNAGGGVHASAIQSVHDLSGNGHTLHFSTGFEVGADYFRNTNLSNISTIDGTEISDDLIQNGYTIEVVAGYEGLVYNTDASFLSFKSSSGIHLACYSFNINQLAISNGDKTYYADSFFKNKITSTSFRSTPSCSINGDPSLVTEFAPPTITNEFKVCNDGSVGSPSVRRASMLKIKSLRVYSRVLYPEEVAANYAVDNARFDLTPIAA